MFMFFLVYSVIGLVFGLAFVFVGYKKIDRTAEGAGIGVRLLWLPAALALWPLVLFRWLRPLTHTLV